MQKVLLSLGGVVIVALGIFIFYVSGRESKFNYERSAVINAPAEKIFPYISNLRLGGQWSPYEKKDPNMKKTFIGPDGATGSAEEFDGNGDVGAGRIEIFRVVPNQSVELKLTMTKPFHAENAVTYKLTPEAGGGTRFSWSMAGDSGFMGKLVSVFIDCEKMITGEFDSGIKNLKTIVESQSPQEAPHEAH